MSTPVNCPNDFADMFTSSSCSVVPFPDYAHFKQVAADKLFAEMSEAWDAECRAWDEPPDFQRWIMRRIVDIVCGVTKGKTSDGRYSE